MEKKTSEHGEPEDLFKILHEAYTELNVEQGNEFQLEPSHSYNTEKADQPCFENLQEEIDHFIAKLGEDQQQQQQQQQQQGVCEVLSPAPRKRSTTEQMKKIRSDFEEFMHQQYQQQQQEQQKQRQNVLKLLPVLQQLRHEQQNMQPLEVQRRDENLVEQWKLLQRMSLSSVIEGIIFQLLFSYRQRRISSDDVRKSLDTLLAFVVELVPVLSDMITDSVQHLDGGR